MKIQLYPARSFIKRALKICLIGLVVLLVVKCEDKAATNPYQKGVSITPPVLTTIEVLDDQALRLHWTFSGTGTPRFVIYRSVGTAVPVLWKITTANIRTFDDEGLAMGTHYAYQVAAQYDENVSARSNKITTAVNIPTPTNLTASAISDAEIELSWTDNCSFEAGYRIERDSGSGFEQIAEVNANVMSYTDTGLDYGAIYSYRVAAFTTQNQSDYSNIFISALVVDIDGNVYQTVKIGNQWWLAENLKVTHYQDGTTIPNLTADGDWTSTSSGAYCYYNNAPSNGATYGVLYNWYAVTDAHDIAPAGWHVPTDAEWQTLVDYLGGGAVAGGKLKEVGTTHWASPNTGATNESGFTALPGGYRYGGNGGYGSMGNYGYFWSATEGGSGSPRYRVLHYNDSGIYRDDFSKRTGFSVRCVRDSP